MIECDELCVLCGNKIAFYHINLNEVFKMCRNPDCEWPFGEDNVEIIDADQVKLDLQNKESILSSSSKISDNTSDVGLSLANLKMRKSSLVSNLKRSRKSSDKTCLITPTKKCKTSDIANLGELDSDDEEKDFEFVKPAPRDDELILHRRLQRATSHIPVFTSSCLFRNPQWNKNIEKINKINSTYNKPGGLQKSISAPAPNISVNIDLTSENGPVIKLDFNEPKFK